MCIHLVHGNVELFGKRRLDQIHLFLKFQGGVFDIRVLRVINVNGPPALFGKGFDFLDTRERSDRPFEGDDTLVLHIGWIDFELGLNLHDEHGQLGIRIELHGHVVEADHTQAGQGDEEHADSHAAVYDEAD